VYEQARSYHRLGQLAAAANDRSAARRHWGRALDGYRQVGAPQAAEIARQLESLDRRG